MTRTTHPPKSTRLNPPECPNPSNRTPELNISLLLPVSTSRRLRACVDFGFDFDFVTPLNNLHLAPATRARARSFFLIRSLFAP